MNAELLRRAASKIEEDHPWDQVGNEFWSAVADWLEEAADHLLVGEESDTLCDPCPTALEGPDCSVLGQAFAVARAYLGEDQ